ncbi:MAG: S-ribosylhomocysteine lyase, partial [Campylobacteraceae bacterium]|jgi:S-ribosylhomocysteine lyase|nr:S-ribosylhomocysteine lyase [Campylobacteraceae bacterium]
MGCRTGFYMSLIGNPKESKVAKAWQESMDDILKIKNKKDIPELNVYQCGTYKLHSLKQARKIAAKILKKGIITAKNSEMELNLSEESSEQNI